MIEVRFYGQDLEPGPQFSRSMMERSVSERPVNSIPTRTTPSGPAFAFRTSPVRVTSMEAPTGSRTETRHPTRSDGWRRSMPRPKFEKSNTPQSRHMSGGSPSTWQEPIQTTDWRCARRRFRSGSGSLIGQIYWPRCPSSPGRWGTPAIGDSRSEAATGSIPTLPLHRTQGQRER